MEKGRAEFEMPRKSFFFDFLKLNNLIVAELFTKNQKHNWSQSYKTFFIRH
jgi:hypothetical protein